MDIDWLCKYCLSLPHTTKQVQWGDSLVFKVGGKMYAVASLEPGRHWLSLKCSPEDFADLIERTGIFPAPYLARANWVALETPAALSVAELEKLLALARDLAFAKLTKKQQSALDARRPQSERKSKARNSCRHARR
jgi:predicted DNA-binding protein (MmcQ/YjbR family)